MQNEPLRNNGTRAVAAEVDGDDAVRRREVLHLRPLVRPVTGAAVNEDERQLTGTVHPGADRQPVGGGNDRHAVEFVRRPSVRGRRSDGSQDHAGTQGKSHALPVSVSCGHVIVGPVGHDGARDGSGSETGIGRSKVKPSVRIPVEQSLESGMFAERSIKWIDLQQRCGDVPRSGE